VKYATNMGCAGSWPIITRTLRSLVFIRRIKIFMQGHSMRECTGETRSMQGEV
jgi:hypothetical protein